METLFGVFPFGDMPPKPVVTDKFRLMIYHQNTAMPPFATEYPELVNMLNGACYNDADKRSIYESMIFVVIRSDYSHSGC